jgi:hypothetical protein
MMRVVINARARRRNSHALKQTDDLTPDFGSPQSPMANERLADLVADRI